MVSVVVEVAVAVLDRVDEHVRGVRVDVVGRRLVGVLAVGIEMQRAVLARNVRAGYRRHQRGGVAVRLANPNHPAARRKTISTRHAFVARPRRVHRQQPALVHIVRVKRRRRGVVDDVDEDGGDAGIPVAVGHLVGEAVAVLLRVGPVVGIRAGVERLGQRVDVAAVAVDLDGAVQAGDKAHQRVGVGPKPARHVVGQRVGGIGLQRTARQAAGYRADRKV